MRPILILALLSLAACGTADPAAQSDAAETATADNRIECRTGAAPFERACTVAREGARLTIRKPDGGFRRLNVVDDGRGVEAADGAEPAVVTLLADRRIEVAIGGDVFRLPATVQAR